MVSNFMTARVLKLTSKADMIKLMNRLRRGAWSIVVVSLATVAALRHSPA